MGNKSWFKVRPNPDANKWVKGTENLIALIQQAKVHPDIKRISLNYLIWSIGDAHFLLDGGKKYHQVKKGKLQKEEMSAKYCSFKAGELLKKEKGKGCRRDRIYGRNWVIDKLIEEDREVFRNIEEYTSVCVVTEHEHTCLTNIEKKLRVKDEAIGWDKYAEYTKTNKEFKILDRESGKEKSLVKNGL